MNDTSFVNRQALSTQASESEQAMTTAKANVKSASARKAATAKKAKSSDAMSTLLNSLFKTSEVITAQELADALNMKSAKTLRAYLRVQFKRALEQKNSDWRITRTIAEASYKRFKKASDES
jgi:response regulator of citrate/malate metabolism